MVRAGTDNTAAHDVTVVALTGALASAVVVTIDVLRTAAKVAGRVGAPPLTHRVVSPDGGPVVLENGVQVPTRRMGRRGDGRSTWVVPGLGFDDARMVDQGLARNDVRTTATALRRHVEGGGRVAAGCSGVFVPAAAGLLDGRSATTAWWLAPVLRDRFPDVDVVADRILCADGPVVTAGAAMAQIDLMLHVVERHGGPELSGLVSRLLVVDAREAQAPYVVPDMLVAGDGLVRSLVDAIEGSMPDIPSVAALAAGLGVSERTLTRHVQRATGRSTSALVQQVRLQRARRLLATTRLSVEQVAVAVGYTDATALRRLVRRTSGLSPRQYRGTHAVGADRASTR